MPEAQFVPETESQERRLFKWRLALFVVWTLIGVSALVYLFGNVISVLSVPMGILVVSIILVFGLRPGVNWLSDKGMPRGLATTIAFIVLIVALVALLLLCTSPIFGIGAQFDAILNGTSDFTAWFTSFFADLNQRYPTFFQNPVVSQWIDGSIESLGTWSEGLAGDVAQSLISLTAFTLNALLVVGFSLVASFWILLEMPKLRNEMMRLFGERRIDDIDFLHLTMTRTLGGYLKGLIILCGLVAIGCSLGYTLVKLPNGIALAMITGLFNVIPVIGQWIAAVLIFITALVTADLETAILAAVVAVVVQRVIYTFVYPKVMADSVDVHPVLVIAAMMIGYAVGLAMGGALGSFVGILLSIPLAAMCKALFVYYFEKKTGRHLVAVDGVFFKGVPNEEDEPDPFHNASSPHPSAYAERLKADARRAALRLREDDGGGEEETGERDQAAQGGQGPDGSDMRA